METNVCMSGLALMCCKTGLYQVYSAIDCLAAALCEAVIINLQGCHLHIIINREDGQRRSVHFNIRYISRYF